MIFCTASLLVAVLTQTAHTALISPCPDVFTYKTSPDLPDRWYGKIDVTADLVEAYMWLYVELDRKAHLFASNKGATSTKNFKEFILETRDYYSKPGEILDAKSFEFVTSYDYAQPIPRVKVIRVNGLEICRDNSTKTKEKPRFPTLPPLPNRLLLAKMKKTGYTPDYLEIRQNTTSTSS